VVVGAARRVPYAVVANCAPGDEFAMIQAIRRIGPMVAGYAARL